LGLLQNTIVHYRDQQMESCKIAQANNLMPEYKKAIGDKYITNKLMLKNINDQLTKLGHPKIDFNKQGCLNKFEISLDKLAGSKYKPSSKYKPKFSKHGKKVKRLDPKQAKKEAYQQAHILTKKNRSIHFQSTKYSIQDMGCWFYENISLQTARSKQTYKTTPKTLTKSPYENKIRSEKPRPSKLVSYLGRSVRTRIPYFVYNTPICKQGLGRGTAGPVNFFTQTYFNVEKEHQKSGKENNRAKFFRTRAELMTKKIRARSPSPGPRREV